MTKKKTPKRKPLKQGISGNAKFKKGQSGNPAGRPKGIDIRKAAQDAAVRAGIDLDEATGDVFLVMMDLALKGDVSAAKLVFDRMCGPVEPVPVQVNIDNRPLPTGPADGDWASHFAKLIEVQNSIASTSANGNGR